MPHGQRVVSVISVKVFHALDSFGGWGRSLALALRSLSGAGAEGEGDWGRVCGGALIGLRGRAK